MTIAVDLGRKATKQTNKQTKQYINVIANIFYNGKNLFVLYILTVNSSARMKGEFILTVTV